MEEINPWHVSQLEAFLYYCCPECDEKNQSKETFLEHALQKHIKSKGLLEKFIVKEEENEHENGKSDSDDKFMGKNNRIKKESIEYQINDSDFSNTILKNDSCEPATDKKYKYDKCSITFGRKEYLDVHNTIVHNGSEYNEYENPDGENDEDIDTDIADYNYIAEIDPMDVIDDEEEDDHDSFDIKQEGAIKDEKTISRKIKKHSRSKNSVECEKCEKWFSNVYVLQRHIKDIHEEHEKEIHACKICGKTFGYKHTLDFHVKSIHERLTECSCNICGKKFTANKNLQVHIKFVHGKNLDCKDCGETFDDIETFKNHLKFVHEYPEVEKNKIPVECKICKKTISNAYALERHIKALHSEDDEKEQHLCKICGKSFAYIHSLQFHIKSIHDRQTECSCEVCGKTFTAPKNLKVHVDLVHKKIKKPPDGKVHMCDLCGKTFTQAPR